MEGLRIGSIILLRLDVFAMKKEWLVTPVLVMVQR